MDELTSWTRLASRTLHRHDRVVIREDRLRLPGGGERRYPVMQLGQSAGIVPLTSEGQIVLVRQYRHVPGEFCWEIPGGGMHPGESADAAAQRELREETGYRAGSLRHLGGFWPNNAYLDEIIHVYLAEDLTPDPLPADQDEYLERGTFPFSEALAMAQDDRITCGLTKLAILWAAVARAAAPTR
ncbi:MAG: hydrolase [candidate division NC10 bacterium]|nr:hydrolase [candidate division NC10 bacterium]